MKVMVLCGGASAERVVSWASGDSVANWIAEAGHDVLKYDPEQPGRTYRADQPLAPSEIGVEAPAPKRGRGYDPNVVRHLLDQLDAFKPDLVFPILHSGYGEDGTLQALLEWLQMPFTGSGSVASALAMDKQIAKVVMGAADVPVLPGFTVDFPAMGSPQQAESDLAARISYPVVVKPLRGGSTVGLTRVYAATELSKALDAVRGQHDNALIEPLFEGRELTVTVIAGEAYPVIEIQPKAGFYDYSNKYTAGRTDYLCPAPIDDKIASAMSKTAVKAFESLGCEGFSRVDFLLADDGKFVCLEVNTLPGMTKNSLVPKSARARGLEPAQLIQKIMDCALRKFARAA